MSNLLILTVSFLVAALVYRFRERILSPLRQFDSRNIARRTEEMRSRYDRYAHYRQTLQIAEEQIEEVTKIMVADPRTGRPVPRFLFDRMEYATLAEAAAVRHQAVVAKARNFYVDLDRIYLSRRGPRDPTVEAPAGSEAPRPEGFKQPHP